MPTSSSPANPWSVGILLPEVWSESLQYLLQQAGFGMALTEVPYPAGSLEGDEAAARVAEVQLQVPAAACAEIEAYLRRWTSDWGLAEEEWELHYQEVGEQSFHADAWQDQWRPFRCAGFVIYPDFHAWDSLPTKPQDRPLQILPGSAFGTGGHVTTRHALFALRWLLERGHDVRRTLDVGTGSGILAVAAALEGAELAAGMDPDPQSPLQATKMAANNGVSERCTFWRGTLASADGCYDLVFANLVAELLMIEASKLAACLAVGGRLFTGGVLAHKRPQVVVAMESAGLSALEASGPWRRRGSWCADIWLHR